MKRHTVEIERIPWVELGYSDVSFVVRRDGKLLGRLLVSIGAIEWRSRRKSKHRLLKWTEFDELMREQGGKVYRGTTPRGRRKR